MKVYIIGIVGSGKTTLSRKMAKKYDTIAYELDKVIWDDDNGHVRRSDMEINKLFKDILSNDSWIIEDVGRKDFTEGIIRADITYYLDLSKMTIYKRCMWRWIKQKLGWEEYNYKPTFKSLIEMFSWVKRDFKNKDEKIKRIADNAKDYRILKKRDINDLERNLK